MENLNLGLGTYPDAGVGWRRFHTQEVETGVMVERVLIVREED